MERILCRARWPLRRLGSPRAIGKTIAVAGYLEVSRERLQCVREAGRLDGAVVNSAEGRSERSPRSESMERAIA
jgi:acyl homoserine lactone synthase